MRGRKSLQDWIVSGSDFKDGETSVITYFDKGEMGDVPGYSVRGSRANVFFPPSLQNVTPDFFLVALRCSAYSK